MRAKNLTDHGSPSVTLTWPDAQLLYDYYKPTVLPEFDSFKSSTISAELFNLLRRIVLSIPTELKPDSNTEELIDSFMSESSDNQALDELEDQANLSEKYVQ